MIRICTLAFVFLPFFFVAQQMRIGVLRDYDVKKIVFAYADASFNVYADTTEVATILPTEFIELSITCDKKISI